MTSAAQKILNDALSLPEEEREQLVEALVVSLPKPSREEVDEAWNEEIVRRVRSREQGEATSESWDKVYRELRAKHNPR